MNTFHVFKKLKETLNTLIRNMLNMLIKHVNYQRIKKSEHLEMKITKSMMKNILYEIYSTWNQVIVTNQNETEKNTLKNEQSIT